MDGKQRWIVGGVAALALVGAGAGLAIASAGDDDRALAGSALRRATEAALDHAGGGTVIETEVGDDGAAYGVEIRLEDGTVLEVALDERFSVIGEEIDDDVAGAEDEGVEDDGAAND